jgi:hypothetical protein
VSAREQKGIQLVELGLLDERIALRAPRAEHLAHVFRAPSVVIHFTLCVLLTREPDPTSLPILGLRIGARTRCAVLFTRSSTRCALGRALDARLVTRWASGVHPA